MSAPRILVTRAAHQASALADQLRARGFEPVLVPTIEIAPPTSYCAVDAALACLPIYHWIAFTSANAVQAFLQRIVILSGAKNLLLPTGTKIAAIGASTARTLESLGTKPDLVPPQAVAESLAAALRPHARQPDGTPTRMLIPCAQETRNVLETELTAAGAEVTVVPVYRNVVPSGSAQALRALFADPQRRPQAVTFTSGSTVLNLLELLRSEGLELPETVRRISIGPITSKALADQHLPAHAEAESSSIESLVDKVAEVVGQAHRKVE